MPRLPAAPWLVDRESPVRGRLPGPEAPTGCAASQRRALPRHLRRYRRAAAKSPSRSPPPPAAAARALPLLPPHPQFGHGDDEWGWPADACDAGGPFMMEAVVREDAPAAAAPRLSSVFDADAAPPRGPAATIRMGIDGLREMNPRCDARRRGGPTWGREAPPARAGELPLLGSPRRGRSPATMSPRPLALSSDRVPAAAPRSPVTHFPIAAAEYSPPPPAAHAAHPGAGGGAADPSGGTDPESLLQRDAWRRGELRRRQRAARAANEEAAAAAAERAERQRSREARVDRAVADRVAAEAAAAGEAERMERGARRRVLGRVRREQLYEDQQARRRFAEESLRREREEFLGERSEQQAAARAAFDERGRARRAERRAREAEIRWAAAQHGATDRAAKYGATEAALAAVPLPGTRDGDAPEDAVAQHRRRAAAEARREGLQRGVEARAAAAAAAAAESLSEACYGISTRRPPTPPRPSGHGRRQFPNKRHR